jgi:CubicO group peptidase (beta-lactamase class C family)
MARASIKKLLPELDNLLIKYFNENALPGLAIGIVDNGELVYSNALGYANLEKEIPVTIDTVFRIMSISKTFTTIGLMQLQEQGKLNIDNPVNQYLKSYKVLHNDPAAPPVTIRHMLTHTSGIGEMRDIRDFLLPVGGLATSPETPFFPLSEYYRGRLTPEIYPGQKWAYANHAFTTLAQVIEEVSGMNFNQYMVEHVFMPLGMEKTGYVRSEKVRDQLAEGYIMKKGKITLYPYLRLLAAGGGAIFSSVPEMAKYMAALMNGAKNKNGKVLNPETLEKMWEPQLDFDERIFSMGLAFFLLQKEYNGHRVVEHSGGWPGFISEMLVAPDDKVGIIVFTNMSSGAPIQIGTEIMRRILDVTDPVKNIPDPKIMETPYDWAQFTGFYGPKPGFMTNARAWGMGFGGEVEITIQNNHLVARTLNGALKKGVVLYRGDASDPYFYQGVLNKGRIPLVFKTNSQGVVDQLEIQSYVLYRRPKQQSAKFRVLTIAGALGGVILAGVLKMIMEKKSTRKCNQCGCEKGHCTCGCCK